MATLLALASPALRAAEPPPHAPDEIVVRFRSPISAPVGGLSAAAVSAASADAGRALARVGALSVRPLNVRAGLGVGAAATQALNGFEPLGRTYRVKLPAGSDEAAAAAAIASDPAVESAELNHFLKLSASPTDSNYGIQWAHRNTGQSGGQDFYDPATGTAGVDVDSEIAWEAETGSSGVIVAVIDSGLDINHPDISGNVWTNPGESNNGLDDDGNGKADDLRGWDFGGDGTNDDNNVADDCGGEEGHGTHVAGIIGAVGNNGTGVTGAAWDVTLMPLKVAITDPVFGCGILQSDVAEAIVYATQKGADVINMSLGGSVDSIAMRTAADAARASGIVLIAAAGNESTSSLIYPGSYSSVLAVAATNRRDLRASFSNFGSWVDLAAPGVAIYSTIPTVQGSYAYLSGTSMSSPLVAGIAALIRSEFPSATASDVETRLLNSCESISATGIGAGRVNAARALLNLSAVSPTTAPAGQSFTLSLTGVAFQSGMTVRLTRSGVSSITGSNLSVAAHNSASADFVVPSASTGVYNVQVVVGQTIITLPNALTVYGLSVSDASPEVWPSGAPTGPITLTGQNFNVGMSVYLRKSGQANIPGINLVVNSQTSATVEFDLTSAAGGRWDVVAASGSFTSVLVNGLAVTTPLYQVITVAAGSATNHTMTIPQGTLSVDWPAGATASPLQVDVNGAPSLPAVDPNRDPFVGTGVGVDLDSIGATPTFAQPYRITLPFRTIDIPEPSKLSALTLAYYNTRTLRWEPVSDVVVDAGAGTVSGSVNHFSHFQIVQHVPALNLDRAVAFPNPFRPDRGHDRIVFDFLPAGATVKIFDLSGQFIRELVDDDADGRVDWIGVTNEDGDKIASGVYYYLASGAGQKKTGRVAVLR